MRTKLYIPKKVKQAIQKHLSEKYPLALEGFGSANEDEHTLIGDLGATLRIKNQIVKVDDDEIVGNWKWGIDYHKFRNGGPGATEKQLGADGIFELIIDDGYYVQKKSHMFQSKIDWINDHNLIEQTIKLTTWKEAAFILNFTSSRYEAIDLDTVLKSGGKRENIKGGVATLDEYFGTTFLDCIVGDVNLKYDAVSRKLFWKTIGGEFVATKFSIPDRISFKITAPNKKYGKLRFDKEIKNEEIHNYRMYVPDVEMLSLSDSYTASELKKAKQSQLLINHPDKFQYIGSELATQILNRRAQEIQYAYEELTQRLEREKARKKYRQ